MDTRQTVLTTLAALLALAGARAQVTDRVSVALGGGEANNESLAGSMTPDGRFVVFVSYADNLVPNDTNFASDVFVRDRMLGTTVRVSVDSNGNQGHGYSYLDRVRWRTISDDGRYVTFWSDAPDLVANDTNSVADVFVRDLLLGQTQRVSVMSGGGQAQPSSSRNASISADGRYVAFSSASVDLVPNDLNSHRDVFVHDRVTQQTIRASVATGGGDNFDQSDGVISGNGLFVAFWTRGWTLVPGDNNNLSDVFVRDLQAGTTERVSLGLGGVDTDGESIDGAISDDGRYVAFASAATNIVVGDTNGADDVFVHDRSTGLTTRVSVRSDGAQVFGPSVLSSLAPDGSHVSFLSWATNLVPRDTNGAWDFFVHAMASGLTWRANLNSCGHESAWDINGNAIASGVTSSGAQVLFASVSPNLAPGDTNVRIDVFVRDSTVPAPAVCAHCSAGTSSIGCRAHISAVGTPSASSPSGFVLGLSGVDGQRMATVFYGITGATWVPWTAGTTSVRCVRAPFQRTHAQSSAGTAGQCDGSIALDWLAYLAAQPGALGAPAQPGLVVNAQGWIRDPTAPGATQLSDAVQFVVEP